MKKDNPIPEQLAIFADRLRQVCRGHRTACAVDGPPGVGKTHTLNAITTDEKKLLRLVSTTAGGLVQMLYRYKDIPVVAFDDFDKALRNEATANVVKQATAPEKVRRITHQTVTAITNAARVSPKGHIAPPVFSVRCGLVMLTNVDMNDPKAVDKTMREHVKALADRGLEFIHVSRDSQHVMEYVVDLAPGLFIGTDKKVVNEVIAFFEENALRFETVSVRRIQSIMQDRITMPERWKQLQAASFVARTSQPQPEQPATRLLSKLDNGMKEKRAMTLDTMPAQKKRERTDEERLVARLRRRLNRGYDYTLNKNRTIGVYEIREIGGHGGLVCACMTLEEVENRLAAEDFTNGPFRR